MVCPLCNVEKVDVQERQDLFSLEVYGRTRFGFWCGDCEKQANADI